MTHFLVSDENPDGYKLEDILLALRTEVINRCTKITGDNRPEARQVLDNNVEILALISDAIRLAENSSEVLNKSFGPSDGKSPRIGEK